MSRVQQALKKWQARVAVHQSVRRTRISNFQAGDYVVVKEHPHEIFLVQEIIKRKGEDPKLRLSRVSGWVGATPSIVEREFEPSECFYVDKCLVRCETFCSYTVDPETWKRITK